MSSSNENLVKLKKKKIAILGLGIENYALVKYLLAKKIPAMITICDNRSKIALEKKYATLVNKKNIAWKLGQYANKNLDGFDILFRSPGWPIYDPGIKSAVKMGVELTSPIKLFFSLCRSKNIVGVTGTKGKGTTASLIYEIFKKANRRAWLGGNIGVAPLDFVDRIKKNDWVVLELSSFQLEDMSVSPHIAVITNFAKEHLSSSDPNNPNCHKSMQGYWRAKARIIKWQKRTDYAVISKRLKVRVMKHKPKARLSFYYKSDLESKLPGEHNRENIAAAIEVAKLAKIKPGPMKTAVNKFRGLEHRLEYVRRAREVSYYDDSFATTPDATITAIKAFKGEIILIAGGAEKGSNFNRLARTIKKRVKFTLLFKGSGTPRLKRALNRVNFPASRVKQVYSMKEAVALAVRKAKVNETVLLSPACASFGLFNNYKERGELFKKEVRKLKI